MKLYRFVMIVILAVPAAAQVPPAAPRANPLLAPSTLPFQAPPFDKITDAHFQPAIEEGMKQKLAEIAAIANDPAPPSFANTIDAMERTGAILRRVLAIFRGLTDPHTSPALQTVEAEKEPKIAANADEIYLTAKLFPRTTALYHLRATLTL